MSSSNNPAPTLRTRTRTRKTTKKPDDKAVTPGQGTGTGATGAADTANTTTGAAAAGADDTAETPALAKASVKPAGSSAANTGGAGTGSDGAAAATADVASNITAADTLSPPGGAGRGAGAALTATLPEPTVKATADSMGACFMVSYTGQIESSMFPFEDSLYCKYTFVYGHDWTVTAGLEDGLTQLSKKSHHRGGTFVWNFPIDVTFKSTNPFGWPKIVLSVYGLDMLGREIARGYGCRPLPIMAGESALKVDMFVPITSNFFQQLIGWIVGKRPEYIDAKFIAFGNGREVTRVQSQGTSTVQLCTVLKDFKRYGFRSTPNEA